MPGPRRGAQHRPSPAGAKSRLPRGRRAVPLARPRDRRLRPRQVAGGRDAGGRRDPGARRDRAGRFQRSSPNSLLHQAVADSAEVQIGYGRRRGVPWGISESAYGDLDQDKNYQYKAFGVPELGLKRDLEQEVVVAPYATLLALAFAPRRAVRNLRRLAELGLLNDFGFYEAMDFSRRPRRRGERGVVVRAHMAHHQGMALLSLANFLHGNSFRRRFHADPRVRAVESLLQERVPTLAPLHYISTPERMPSVEGVIG